MKTLNLLSRVAFICNIFFILALSLRISNYIGSADLRSMILIFGYIMAILFNGIVNLAYLFLLTARRKFWLSVPSWLITANIMFLLLQVLYIVYLNDTQHS